MPQRFGISIDQVVNLLGLEREPRVRAGSSYNVRCPFCEDKKYHMNINTEKDTYNCLKCGGKSGGGALDLYGRVRIGVELKPGKAASGGNGNVLFRALCEELNIGQTKAYTYKQDKRPEAVRIVRASDEALDKAYKALLDFPPFALSDAHKANLLKRGLDVKSIEENHYRSITSECKWLSRFSAYVRQYELLELEEECLKYEKLKFLTKEQRVAGFVVASVLSSFRVNLEGVPGFFKLKGRWFFKTEVGMLIPTRNKEGEIVGLQARKDSGDLRYMTISSKGLPEGVTEGISRLHYPLSNDPLKEGVPVLLTEGPLKADVALHLLHEKNQSCYFVAVQGVNNTNEIPIFFNDLKKSGIMDLYNALDMDKITNPHVAKACRSIKALARSMGINICTYMWDIEFAKEKFYELVNECKRNNIRIDMDFEGANIFVCVGKIAAILSKNGIDHSLKIDEDGVIALDKKGDPVHRYWSENTKGIDDYLLGLEKA